MYIYFILIPCGRRHPRRRERMASQTMAYILIFHISHTGPLERNCTGRWLRADYFGTGQKIKNKIKINNKLEFRFRRRRHYIYNNIYFVIIFTIVYIYNIIFIIISYRSPKQYYIVCVITIYD